MKTKDGKELHNTSKILADKYGAHGSDSRDEFTSKSMAWYYGEILKERRKKLHVTQKDLALKIGKEQSYIAKIEKGETDMQLSSFIRIADALGLKMFLADNIAPSF